ncbi:MAG TPA: LCP family protein [Candidatus Dormibacteraeota bacterium]|nr:LCP family protein [Candidatus Dormibacteraeota bacterium]HEV2477711.1 LCP family protein [Candidatus Dormibacteraeota bacterium]
MSRPRPKRARRSRYSVSYRLTRSFPAAIVAALLLVVIVGATLTYKRLDDFVTATTGHHINPIGEVVQAVAPQPGTIAYKLQHGQQVNVLLLGMGGYENDAPFLTDSIMAVSIDPTSNRVMMASIPRDLVVHMNLQSNPSRIWTQKINAAYEVPYTSIICCVASQYTGPNGGGLAAEHEVSKVTGLTFDHYIAIDFVAFRDMVNALGGVDVCLSTNLDDLEYPNYNNGYMPIHFKAGCQHLNGEQALEIARSRHALQPEQSSDFGRARRQQDIMEAIKKKATTVNGFAKAPALLSALQKNIHTDMSLTDMKAIYDWGKNLPDSSIVRVALTAPSGAAQGNLLDSYDCGLGPYTSQLCADDQSYTMIHKYLASVLIDPKTLAEKAPVQFVNGSNNFPGLDQRVTTMFDPTGLALNDPVGHRPTPQTQILDYSGGKFPLTAKYLQDFFGAPVVNATPANPAPAAGQQTYGLVVVIGHDFALHWLGE